MTRQEFLHELGLALQGEVRQSAVSEHVNYYENYIIEESRKGKTEEEVIAQLGNPRLIAKTLIDTTDQLGQTSQDEYYEEADNAMGNKRGLHADYSEEKGWNIKYGQMRLNSWYGKALLILFVILVIIIVANVVAFLLPIVIPVVLIFSVIWLIRGNRR